MASFTSSRMSKQSQEFADVPTQVFRKFLDGLAIAKIPEELVERFRKTMFENEDFSERALKQAIFGDEHVE
jgi:hypothetical protein